MEGLSLTVMQHDTTSERVYMVSTIRRRVDRNTSIDRGASVMIIRSDPCIRPVQGGRPIPKGRQVQLPTSNHRRMDRH